jgi:hypothetical protein
MNRGRPSGQMTHRRRQVLAECQEQIAAGGRITIARLVRVCHLTDRSSAYRIVRDLKRLGQLA